MKTFVRDETDDIKLDSVSKTPSKVAVKKAWKDVLKVKTEFLAACHQALEPIDVIKANPDWSWAIAEKMSKLQGYGPHTQRFIDAVRQAIRDGIRRGRP